MSSLSEAAERAYDRACGIRHSLSHHPATLWVTKELIDGLARDYSVAKDHLNAVVRDDGALDCDTVAADFICTTIREAAMAAMICGAIAIQGGRNRALVLAGLSADKLRDCLVASFGVEGWRADAFVNILGMVVKGGILEAALRGVCDRAAKVMGLFQELTRPRGQFDLQELFAQSA